MNVKSCTLIFFKKGETVTKEGYFDVFLREIDVVGQKGSPVA
jgi:hypothetical protein